MINRNPRLERGAIDRELARSRTNDASSAYKPT